jgi:hypothetical protein
LNSTLLNASRHANYERFSFDRSTNEAVLYRTKIVHVGGRRTGFYRSLRLFSL